jgi:hypothetical protein
VSRGRRELHATLLKGALWPTDRAWLPQLDVEALKPEAGHLGEHLVRMFSVAESASKFPGARPAPPAAGRRGLFDAKETLQILFVRHSEVRP